MDTKANIKIDIYAADTDFRVLKMYMIVVARSLKRNLRQEACLVMEP